MKRREDWPETLSAAITAREHTPFAWGTNDCLLTVADLIEAVTGEDPASTFRGRYNSEAGALRIVSDAGAHNFEGLLEQVTKSHRFPEISPKLAQRGDLVLFDAQEGTAFGVVGPNGREAIFQGTEGLRRLPVLSARRAWKVA